MTSLSSNLYSTTAHSPLLAQHMHQLRLPPACLAYDNIYIDATKTTGIQAHEITNLSSSVRDLRPQLELAPRPMECIPSGWNVDMDGIAFSGGSAAAAPRSSGLDDMRRQIHINSLSSGLMLGTTLFRNEIGIGNKLVALFAYPVIAAAAVVESAVALAFTILSLVIYPVSSDLFKHSSEWLKSSSFSIPWALTNFAVNLFCPIMVADEPSAHKVVRNLLSSGPNWLPYNALTHISA